MLEWSDGSFDPEDIDERDIRMIIGNFAARRRGPLLSQEVVLDFRPVLCRAAL